MRTAVSRPAEGIRPPFAPREQFACEEQPFPRRGSVSLLLRLTLLLLFVTGMNGCGYRIGGPYRQDIRTVHVPIFTSASFRRGIEFELTEAVHKEIQLLTHFRLVKSGEADTRLTGQIVQINKAVLGESGLDDPRELQFSLAVQVTWEDLRSGKRETQTIPIAPELVHLLSTSSFAPELGQSLATARQQAVQRMARQIVRMMQEPW
ncbi:MAG: hypothetical protein IID45_02260 [Planctomycetes bacterium]|nr:hypothetical protein [Planctomycetota bacterium]